MDGLTDDQLADVAAAAEQYLQYKRTHRMEFINFPDDFHEWQLSLFRAGANKRERMALAGNRTGKTFSSTYEVALHLTGLYPDDWEGYRFNYPITCWALGVDALQVKDVLQSELFGILDDKGFDSTGWITADLVTAFSRSSQTTGLARDVQVKHVMGGVSTLSFRAYSQSNRGAGTTAFAGSSVDLILVDEQPSDPELHGQLVTRTMTGDRGLGGKIIYSMTPELGETELVHQFLHELGPHQYLAQVTWDDCPHLTPDIQEQILKSIPKWQHDMRRLGLPFMGSGRIFTVAEERLKVQPFEIPEWWKWLAGIDFGIDHPTAWAKMAYDPENDVIYVTHVYRKSDTMVSEDAAHINGASEGFIETIYPHDGHKREKGSGKALAVQYRDAGCRMSTKFHNCDKDKTIFVEPGLQELDERMRSDRFKVFAGCAEFFDEYRRYHRDDKGQIVALHDDVLSAVRYGGIMIPTYGVSRKQAQTRHSMGNSLSPNIEV